MTDYDRAIEHFNNQEFYVCHDLLEELWHNAEPEFRGFYQGLLQIAVGCYHLQQSNYNGAKILLGEGCYRLAKYPSSYAQINVEELLELSQTLLSELQRSAVKTSYLFPTIDRVLE